MYRLSSHLSRLTAATYHDVNASNTATASNRYNETLAYDLRGNITALQRTGYYSSACNYGQIDNLAYTYTASTNRLASITDSAPASQKTHGFNTGSGGAGYTYDTNGNLKTDSYKGITNIAYNHLNLPNVVTFSSGNIIEWIYDAAGMKLRKIVKQGGTVQYEQTYAGGLEYRKNGTGSTRVEAIYHAEGRYLNLNAEVNNTLLWQKEYALRDHLGNTRMMFADKNANGIVETPGEITQENHYYPFGLGYEGPWLMNDAVARDNKYQYNGKEWNDDWGLKWNDYGARNYDPSIGQFIGVDMLAGKYANISPFVYVSNNPMLYIDPDGMRIDVSDILRKNKKGEYINSDIAQAFLYFAKSDLGKQILANFAQAGQEIAGHKYKENGRFHKKGIDLSFHLWEGNYKQEDGFSTGFGANGVTSFTDNGDGTAKIGIYINKELNSSSNDDASNYEANPSDPAAKLHYQLSRSSTIFHEAIIHAKSDAIDFMDDCRINCSNYSNFYGIDPNSEKGKGQIQHIYAKMSNSEFIQKGVPAIIDLHRQAGSKRSPTEVKKRLLNFNN